MVMVTPPTWLTVVSVISLGIGFLCAGVILYDIFVRGHRQRPGAMEAVWPITAVYFGPLALLAYYRWRLLQSRERQEKNGQPPQRSLSVEAVLETIPGGAASFVGHLIAVPLVVVLSLTIAGRGIWPMIILIALFALPLLFAFEYFSTGKGLGVALLTAAVAIVAFDVGMGAAMIFVNFVLMFPPTTIAFWFIMQIGLILGFATAYPVVLRMVRGGVEEAA